METSIALVAELFGRSLVGGVPVSVRPREAVTILAFVTGGIVLGTCSGLTPGLHANNFALLLSAAAPSIPAPPLYIGTAMLAAGVTHTFLDIVPALALGVPDAAMAATALPGHRLVLQGRGREALRLSALGSALAVAFALPLAVPITLVMTRAYPLIVAHLSAVLGTVAVLIVLTESTMWARLGATATLAGSGLLGVTALGLPAHGLLPAGSMLAPLFAGLFGAPVLIEGLDGGGVPPQGDRQIATTGRFVTGAGLIGTLAGAVVGYLPGISSAVAAAGALTLVPDRGPRAFVVATSGVNTANTVFALFALVALGNPRTGVLVAVENTGVPHNLPVLLATVTIAAGAGFVLVLLVGDQYLDLVGSLDNRRLSVAVLGVLGLLVVGFAGVAGLGVFVLSTLVGLLPALFGARRMNCMGVLLVPLAL